MRRGHDFDWLYDDEKMVAINLGSDYCAEHEWGIEGIKRAFGISEPVTRENLGIAARTIKALPEDLHLLEHEDLLVLVYVHAYSQDKSPEAFFRTGSYTQELTLRGDKRKSTAWDENSFGIVVKDKEDKDRLKELWEAFQKKDIVIWLGGGGVFQNAGLVLAIPSRMPPFRSQLMAESDLENIEVIEAAEKTGIELELRAAGKKWYALAPRFWQAANKGVGPTPLLVDGKKVLKFWLNPMDQHLHNFGWFTVEELRLWLIDQGPIPMTDEQKRTR